ncbi:MAG: tetratricopeptide repeat protein [Bacteriovoracaceae bacterium]|nr:tetratricopeptide repeat protein [Bacteriovoracaceae bacterium]
MNKIYTLILVLLLSVSCSSTSKKKKDLTESEKKAALHYSHGTEKLVSKNYTMALNHLLQAVKMNPEDPKIQNNLGMAYYFKGKLGKAINHLRKAVELDPENFDALNNLASIYFKQGRFALAKDQYKKVLEKLHYPHQYRTHYNMALISLREGSEAKARKHLGFSITENKDYCPSYFLLGKLEFGVKNYNRAYENFHNAGLGTCYKEPAPYFWKGKTLVNQNRYFKAEQLFRELMKKYPNSVYARKAAVELRNLKSKEILAKKIKEQNFRYNNVKKPLQSKQEKEAVESPSF